MHTRLVQLHRTSQRQPRDYIRLPMLPGLSCSLYQGAEVSLLMAVVSVVLDASFLALVYWVDGRTSGQNTGLQICPGLRSRAPIYHS